MSNWYYLAEQSGSAIPVFLVTQRKDAMFPARLDFMSDLALTKRGSRNRLEVRHSFRVAQLRWLAWAGKTPPRHIVPYTRALAMPASVPFVLMQDSSIRSLCVQVQRIRRVFHRLPKSLPEKPAQFATPAPDGTE